VISSVGAAFNRDPQVGKCITGHAAPAELIAIWIPITIKILLLRSTISIFEMSKLLWEAQAPPRDREAVRDNSPGLKAWAWSLALQMVKRQHKTERKADGVGVFRACGPRRVES
jgi:hypothetical protein